MRNHTFTLRMDYSRAREILRTAGKITAAELTKFHLDVLRESDITITTRIAIDMVNDARLMESRPTDAITHLVEEWNVRVGKI